jgi:DNA-binding NarL/FixJ family response regulator
METGGTAAGFEVGPADPNFIRVLIVDDHAIVREGLRTLLDEEPGIRVVGEAANGAEAITLVKRVHPDVVLMDLVMPEMDGIQATTRVREVNRHCKVLVLTSFADNARVHEAIAAGAMGYLLKDVLKPDLLRAIRNAAQGRSTLHPDVQQLLMQQATAQREPKLHDNLTEREMSVLRLIAHGKSNKEIASALFLTEGTVKGYISTILDKLDVEDRTQAALYAVRHKLVDAY